MKRSYLVLFVRSKFYLRQVISIAFGVAIGVLLSLLLAPFLDQMCSSDGNRTSSVQQNAGRPQPRPVLASSPASQPPLQVTMNKNRPHFLSHELGIRNKLLSVTIVTSAADLPLVKLLYQNLHRGTDASNLPYSVVSILSGQHSLISSMEQELKANMSNFLTMRIPDSQLTVAAAANPATSFGQYVDDQSLAANTEDANANRLLTLLLAKTLFKVTEQYRTQFDWFSIAFPQVYTRFDKLYEELTMMTPIYERVLLVPQSLDSGYSCDSHAASRRPFKSILLSNKLMNEIYAELQSSQCPKGTSSVDSLDCLDTLFKEACFASFSKDTDLFKVADYPSEASLMPSIASSLAVYPVVSTDQYLALNKLFLENDYNTTLQDLASVREELARLVVNLPPGENKPSWPIDVQPPLKPRQRFDIAPWQFLNATHVFFTDEYTTVQPLAGPDLEDVQGVTASACNFVEKEQPNRYKFISLDSGFRKFDPVRGMEYLLYILFDDMTKHERVMKFMHVLKPLNRLEPINAPHVTEDAVITLVVPVFVEDSDEPEEMGISFLEQVLSLLKVGDRLKLWLLLVYPSSTTAVDPFMKLKSLVADGESQFPGRLAWLSVQTSHRSSLHLFEAVVRSRQSASNKDSDDWLVLMLPPESLLSREFLNRVRLMTIRRYQVYFPIAFSQYHPDLIAEPLLLSAINGPTTPPPTTVANRQATTPSTDPANVVELTSRHGHFDQFDFDTAAFYLSDYSECRRTSQANNNNDKANGEQSSKQQKQQPVDVADVFLACTELHVFRAVDPGLKRLYRQSQTSCDSFMWSEQALDSCRARLEIGLGNRKHMAAKLSEHMSQAASLAPGDSLPLKDAVVHKVVDEERDYEDHHGDLLNLA